MEKGDYGLSEKERKQVLLNQYHDIANIISTTTLNPLSKKPYPQKLIEKAMKEIGYSVNINKNAKQQVYWLMRK